jgi:outer membrane protein OmpA-like peptidoglycan-associated protein/ABC-type taurine transport system substrate-binding protein
MAALTWIVLIGGAAVAYKYLLHPTIENRLKRETGSESRYTDEIKLALDSFSGYGIFRSDNLQRRLGDRGIRLTLADDEADYSRRIKALKDGDVDMAVFTVDSLVAAGARLGEYPATIVLVIDETRGADAMIAFEQGASSIQDLNDPAARIVLTPNSPSEFLARIAIANFNLPRLPGNWMIEADGAADVYHSFRGAAKSERTAYVLWEPYVSRALEEEGAVVLLDSSKVRGYIMDVLVAQREFLAKRPDLVAALVEAYLRVLYEINQERGLVELVMEDAEKTGLRGLKHEQAENLVKGIEWKNTLENYAHFGLLRQSEAKGLMHLEDVIDQISEVLVKTGVLKRDPLSGQAHTLFYKKVLRDLKTNDFHPGRAVNVIAGTGIDAGNEETVRGVAELPALRDEEWDSLAEVGEMRIRPLAFARGTARLNIESKRNLSELARQFKSFPTYYLVVVGNARAEGDREANLRLAGQRADAAAAFLIEEGLRPNRVKARAGTPSGEGGAAQSVTFIVGQRPY